MEKHSTFVALDVHKDSTDVSIAEEWRTGEVRHYGKIPSDLRSIAALIEKLGGRGRMWRPTGARLDNERFMRWSAPSRC
jgi:hypothetical protein